MASKKTLNAGNLQALGAERLAALLIEISDGNATAKRRLRSSSPVPKVPRRWSRKSANASRRSHGHVPS
jgi:hypothetical protein